MRLLSCHVENFGKLHDFHMDFSPDYHVICEENGFGKSTLAAFIRVMFYGFSGEAKRIGLENERKRYKPWQGGVYGGTLYFEAAGGRYGLTRIFADKAQNDEFELRDLSTNLISSDFTEKLGEELFFVNRESFMRSVFIGQNDLITGATDDIQAKIGNLTDNTNDLNSFEEADKRFSDYINALSPRRKTGLLYKLKESATVVQTQIRALDGIEEAMDKQREYLDRTKTDIEAVKAEMEKIAEKQTMISKQKDALSKKELYEHLCEELKKKEQELSDLQSAYEKNIPKKAELEEMSAKQKEAEALLLKIQSASLSEAEMKRLEVLKTLFSEEDNPEERIFELSAAWNERTMRNQTLVMKESSFDSMLHQWKGQCEEKERKNHRIALLMTAVGVILAAAGIITAVYIVGIFLLIAGIVLIIFGIRKKKEKQEETMPPELFKLESDIMQDKKYICTAEENVKAYLTKKQKEYTTETALKQLQALLAELAELEQLRDKERKAAIERERLDDVDRLNEQIGAFLLRYGTDAAADFYAEAIDRLKEKATAAATSLKNKTEDKESARRKKEAFESEQDIAELMRKLPSEDAPDLKELNCQYKEKADESERLHQTIREYEKRLEGLREQSDTLEEKQKQLDDIQAEIEEKTQLYNRLNLVQELMRQAKESLTQKYVAPLKNSFEHYCGILTNDQKKAYYMDANARITVDERGMQRDTECLSTGYQDLISLCLRLSFADAMYPDEKPMLVLDDPLVNLDEDKVSGGRRLLAEVSKKYQIIYFTCHGSRC